MLHHNKYLHRGWCDTPLVKINIDKRTNVRYNYNMIEVKMYSELELLVMQDMVKLDFDPLNEADVTLYWEMVLG